MVKLGRKAKRKRRMVRRLQESVTGERKRKECGRGETDNLIKPPLSLKLILYFNQ
jgi:hypothetical protein